MCGLDERYPDLIALPPSLAHYSSSSNLYFLPLGLLIFIHRFQDRLQDHHHRQLPTSNFICIFNITKQSQSSKMPPNSTPFISVLRTLSQSTTRLSLRHHPLFKSLPKYPQRTPQRLIHTSTPLRNFEQPLETSPKTHQPRPSPPKPEYQLTFTCDPCGTRSTHKVSKQGYHHGSVLIQCPQCKNRHVMSDHLNVSKVSTLRKGYVKEGC